ncbi:MAG: ISL3 family transposase [Candidatus Brocadia sp.]|nr:MAG: ISL3 family transposase [Candidatus Brocadia sp.]
MKREKLPWLANNPFYTKRFAHYVGRKCRAMTVKDVAKELKRDWHTVKALKKEYLQEQLRRNPVAAPRAIGIDEISQRKGHTYRIVVSDLERGKPIWFGGEDRSEASLDMFYHSLGPKKSKKIELAVMDMWKAFEKSTKRMFPGGNPVRQVSRYEASGRCIGQDKEDGVRASFRERSVIHQGTEVYAFVES